MEGLGLCQTLVAYLEAVATPGYPAQGRDSGCQPNPNLVCSSWVNNSGWTVFFIYTSHWHYSENKCRPFMSFDCVLLLVVRLFLRKGSHWMPYDWDVNHPFAILHGTAQVPNYWNTWMKTRYRNNTMAQMKEFIWVNCFNENNILT